MGSSIYLPHVNIVSRAFHTRSDLLGDLVILPLHPTDQKSKIAAKYTASDGGSKSAQLAHVPDRKQASQADSEPPYEAMDLAQKFFHRLILSIEHSGKSPWL